MTCFRPIISCDLCDYTFMIYNRWGEKLFETKNVFDSWDGKHEGRVSMIGSYVFFCELYFKKRYEQNKKRVFYTAMIIQKCTITTTFVINAQD